MNELEQLGEDARASEEAKKAERDGILAKLRAVHKFIAWWEIDGYGLIVCRRMRRSEYISFSKASEAALKQAEASGDQTALMNVAETEVKTLCVWPENREVLTKIFDEYPSWSSTAAVTISKLGSSAGIVEGKD